MRDRKIADEVVNRVQVYIENHALLTEGETVLVGVSGGPDSVCLLHVMHSLRDKLGIRLRVAHLNHGLRGSDAEGDAAYVTNLAQSLGLPCTVETRNVREYRSNNSGRTASLEEAAREARYSFFADVAEKTGATRVAVGHTLDDQVESILLHVVRGSGLRGLKGMAPLSLSPVRKERPLMVLRPLLEVTRDETNAYCQALALSPRVDASNYSLAFLRNRIRAMLPELRSLNPAVDRAFLRLGQAAGEVMEFLTAEIARLWPEVVTQNGPGLSIEKDRFRRLPPALQRHMLLTAWERWHGNPQDLESVHVEGMMEAIGRPVGTRLHLPGGIEFRVGYDRMIMGPRGDMEDTCPYPPLAGEQALQVPGDTGLPGWYVVATVLPVAEAPPRSFPQRGEGEDKLSAWLDFEKAEGGLWVRGRRPGDRFRPLGLTVEKKLQDFMVDLKIPSGWRDRVPLVCSRQGIVWVVGYRISDTFKITERTQRVLHLEFRRRTQMG